MWFWLLFLCPLVPNCWQSAVKHSIASGFGVYLDGHRWANALGRRKIVPCPYICNCLLDWWGVVCDMVGGHCWFNGGDWDEMWFTEPLWCFQVGGNFEMHIISSLTCRPSCKWSWQGSRWGRDTGPGLVLQCCQSPSIPCSRLLLWFLNGNLSWAVQPILGIVSPGHFCQVWGLEQMPML